MVLLFGTVAWCPRPDGIERAIPEAAHRRATPSRSAPTNLGRTNVQRVIRLHRGQRCRGRQHFAVEIWPHRPEAARRRSRRSPRATRTSHRTGPRGRGLKATAMPAFWAGGRAAKGIRIEAFRQQMLKASVLPAVATDLSEQHKVRRLQHQFATDNRAAFNQRAACRACCSPPA